MLQISEDNPPETFEISAIVRLSGAHRGLVDLRLGGRSINFASPLTVNIPTLFCRLSEARSRPYRRRPSVRLTSNPLKIQSSGAVTTRIDSPPFMGFLRISFRGFRAIMK